MEPKDIAQAFWDGSYAEKVPEENNPSKTFFKIVLVGLVVVFC